MGNCWRNFWERGAQVVKSFLGVLLRKLLNNGDDDDDRKDDKDDIGVGHSYVEQR